MAQNGIKRVERPEGSDGMRSSVPPLIHPFALQATPATVLQGIPPAPITATPVQQVTASAIITTIPDDSNRPIKRQKLEKSPCSDGSGDEEDEEEHEVPHLLHHRHLVASPHQVVLILLIAPAMMITTSASRMYGQLTALPPYFRTTSQSTNFYLTSTFLYPPNVRYVPNP
eukprot:TRINITY_DN8128_c0_g1_i1.p1 TRINITY_DN8128_c0_g1~~TRINITY_DN8128_c0_g1_i1.p1  ORF type:complete len:171 (+),score=7.50 TRINITY_DN8128_c0_g1_i1:463-975(+)